MIPYRSLSLLSLRSPSAPWSIFLCRVHLRHKHQHFEPHPEDRKLDLDSSARATVRVKKSHTQHAAAQGEGSTIKRSQSSLTQTSYKDRARGGARSSTQTSYKDRARGGAQEEEEEEQHSQQRGHGPPNVAVPFAELVNAILKRVKEEGIKDKLYDQFMMDCKKNVLKDLKRTYEELNCFYNNPTETMPFCLASSPPAMDLYTDAMDMRLSGKKVQIQQDLLLFAEELGFECLDVMCIDWYKPSFSLRVRLDVAIVATTDAQTSVENKLLALENV